MNGFMFWNRIKGYIIHGFELERKIHYVSEEIDFLSDPCAGLELSGA